MSRTRPATTLGKPFTFTYYGVIVPKERPRLGKSGNFYTPSRTRASEQAVKAAILMALGRERPEMTGRFVVTMEFVGQPGDGDNLAKTVLDAGEGLLWEDDKQVGKFTVSKVPGQSSWAKVTVRRLQALGSDSNSQRKTPLNAKETA